VILLLLIILIGLLVVGYNQLLDPPPQDRKPLQPQTNNDHIEITSGGPIQLCPLPPIHRTTWFPPSRLPRRSSTHPLEISITCDEANNIVTYSRMPPTRIIARSQRRPSTKISVSDFRDQISHGAPTIDDIMAIFLETFGDRHDIPFLCPQVIPLLRSDGWSLVKRFFAGPRRHRSIFRPCITGERALIIPCFVHNNHWAAAVRREINGQVAFFYADDPHNRSTESSLRLLLSQQTDTHFYPPSA
jgi:hypothetical protein